MAEVTYSPGDTQHFATLRPGEFMTRDLTNIGDTEFVFTTVEFLDSANAPLSVPVAGRGGDQAAQGDSEKLRDWGDGKRKLMQEGL